MSTESVALACDLTQLGAEHRRREHELLATFRRLTVRTEESDGGWRFFFTPTQDVLAQIGELFALERLCCPFLEFRLEVGAHELAAVHVFGGEGAKAVIAAEFMKE